MADDSVSVLHTVEHPCGYFPERKARNLVIDPGADGQQRIYDAVAASGFRRAGNLTYRPHCRVCQACEASRLPVANFRPNRSQQRCLRGNSDLKVSLAEAKLTPEYLHLYQRYVNQKHPAGGMQDPEAEDFQGFLLSNWCKSLFLECRLAGELMAVAVTDRLGGGLSAVYCFYNPDQSQRSLGTFAILQQIELTRAYKLPYLYLGYWIENHPKMNYKKNFRGLELFRSGQWLSMEAKP